MAPYKGGIETYSNEILKRLEKKHKVTVITYWHPDRKRKKNVIELKPIVKNRTRDFFNYFLSTIWISLKLDFDVIHSSDFATGLPGLVIKLIRQKPIIATIHDTGFTKYNPQWSKTGFYLRKYLRKVLCKLSDKVVLPSNGIKNQVIRALKVDHENFAVIPYGVDKKLLNPRVKGVMRKRLKIPNDMFVVYYSGMLYPKKGLEYAVEAMKYVREKTDNFVFVIDGLEIFPGYVRKLKEIRDKFNLQDKIIFSGLAKEREKWYVDCDVFILPSIDADGLSLTCLEAGACGKPAIATTFIQETEGVIKDKTALVVPIKNPKAIANAVIKLMKDKTVREKLAKGNYEYSLKFDWDKAVEDMEDIYSELSYR